MLPVKYAPQPATQDRVVGFLFKTALLGGVTYFAFRAISDLLKTDPNKQQGKETVTLLQKLNKNPQTRQTMSNVQFETYANGIFQAMDGYGTDETYIFTVFSKLKNNADFLALSAAYGTREISSGSWNPEANYTGPLSGALANELDPEDLQIINQKLASKGIQFRV